MQRIPPSGLRESAPVVLGPQDRFDGLLTFRGEARVEGELRGEILAQGRLEIGPPARIEARIEADEVVVAGVVRGDLVARQRIELLAGARVMGDLRAPRIAIEEGCLLAGRCEMGTPERGEGDPHA
ncbi:MAG: polymer-forming cytoskeletal protein [Deltaproteobacteria bacterium]|nr:polymer-forming cytoskeletal protein [Deltaproteobacteria bacterium]MBW2421403.1 polymer-forming cytoskeletal protein [Deltaproteobacteria bacterium]